MSKSGIYKFIDGELVRVGEARARPDEPWHNGSIDWANGVKNPSTGETFKNKTDYLDSVKRIGGTVMGNDASISKKEIKGDFNVKTELKQAIQQVLK